MLQSILYERSPEGVGLLTIHRPQARNALTWQAMDEFSESIESISRDKDLRALVLTGSEGAFCSGGDLYELHDYPTHADGKRLSTVMTAALERLSALPIPSIAAIEGPALGGGAEIALACDLRVMAEEASLGMMHIKLAISPAWGGAQRLLRLVGYATALEWLTLGRVLSAQEAFQAGVINRIAPLGQALDAALELARSIAGQVPSAVQAIKRILHAGIRLSPEEAQALEQAEFPELWAATAHLEASTRFVARRRENHPVR